MIQNFCLENAEKIPQIKKKNKTKNHTHTHTQLLVIKKTPKKKKRNLNYILHNFINRKKALPPCLFFSTPISQIQRKRDMILISDVQTNLSLFII